MELPSLRIEGLRIDVEYSEQIFNTLLTLFSNQRFVMQGFTCILTESVLETEAIKAIFQFEENPKFDITKFIFYKDTFVSDMNFKGLLGPNFLVNKTDTVKNALDYVKYFGSSKVKINEIMKIFGIEDVVINRLGCKEKHFHTMCKVVYGARLVLVESGGKVLRECNRKYGTIFVLVIEKGKRHEITGADVVIDVVDGDFIGKKGDDDFYDALINTNGNIESAIMSALTSRITLDYRKSSDNARQRNSFIQKAANIKNMENFINCGSQNEIRFSNLSDYRTNSGKNGLLSNTINNKEKSANIDSRNSTLSYSRCKNTKLDNTRRRKENTFGSLNDPKMYTCRNNNDVDFKSSTFQFSQCRFGAKEQRVYDRKNFFRYCHGDVYMVPIKRVFNIDLYVFHPHNLKYLTNQNIRRFREKYKGFLIIVLLLYLILAYNFPLNNKNIAKYTVYHEKCVMGGFDKQNNTKESLKTKSGQRLKTSPLTKYNNEILIETTLNQKVEPTVPSKYESEILTKIATNKSDSILFDKTNECSLEAHLLEDIKSKRICKKIKPKFFKYKYIKNPRKLFKYLISRKIDNKYVPRIYTTFLHCIYTIASRNLFDIESEVTRRNVNLIFGPLAVILSAFFALTITISMPILLISMTFGYVITPTLLLLTSFFGVTCSVINIFSYDFLRSKKIFYINILIIVIVGLKGATPGEILYNTRRINPILLSEDFCLLKARSMWIFFGYVVRLVIFMMALSVYHLSKM